MYETRCDGQDRLELVQKLSQSMELIHSSLLLAVGQET